MSWDDLRYFLAAYRHRSLAGAAREIGCEYTTVGRRVAALEAALSTTLFLRTPEGLSPTDAAHELIPLAEQLERTATEIERRAAGHDARPEGSVRVTCPEGFSAYLVEPLVALRAAHPGVVVEILSDVRTLDLTRREADVALRMGPTPRADLVTRTLGVMTWRMFATEAYTRRHGVPDPVDDLRGHEIVGYEDGLAHVPGAGWLEAHGAGATTVFRGNSLRSVVDAAASGLGLTVLPHFLASREPRLVALAPDALGTRVLSMVVHRDLRKVTRVRVVMDFLAEVIVRDHARGMFG